MITTDELKVQLAEYHTAVKDLEEALAIDASRKRVQELEHTMSRPGFYDDAELSKKVFDEVGDLKGKLTRFEKLQGLYDDAETMLVMLDEEYDPEMVPEAEEAVNAVGKAVDELQLMTMLNGEYDHSNAILTFHAGTGGTEAQDWAEMLYRMYNKWAQAHGMTVEVLDYQDGDEAGMKSASMMVKGANAYGLLKSENGVHRLVRVSPFDANARRQTSFASLEVMPELDNTIQVDIRPEDIEMQVYRSSGAGGQHINKTSSAVRLIHKPTGIVVSCQTQRSQFQNRDYAMEMLKAKTRSHKRSSTWIRSTTSRAFRTRSHGATRSAPTSSCPTRWSRPHLLQTGNVDCRGRGVASSSPSRLQTVVSQDTNQSITKTSVLRLMQTFSLCRGRRVSPARALPPAAWRQARGTSCSAATMVPRRTLFVGGIGESRMNGWHRKCRAGSSPPRRRSSRV